MRAARPIARSCGAWGVRCGPAAWPWSWGAALLILISRQGAVGPWAVNASYFMLAAGWVMVIAAIWMRTRHHKRRLAEGL